MIKWGFNWEELINAHSSTHLSTSISPHFHFPPPEGTDAAPHQGEFTWGLHRGLCKWPCGCTLQIPVSENSIPKVAKDTTLLGAGWALSLGKVRKPQKPGRKDLLGVNIAFSLKIKFSSLRFHRYFIDITVGIKPGSKLSSNWYGFVEKRGQCQDTYTTMNLVLSCN